MFGGKFLHYVIPYGSPASDVETRELFKQSRKRISISGVLEKFSVLLEKNKLRLTRDGERGTYILKPVPLYGIKPDQMPANEHLTMQLARQVYKIETAENALIFFRDGSPAYMSKKL